MSTANANRVKPLLDFTKSPEPGFLARVNSVLSGLPGNPAYPTPPVDPAVLKAAADSYANALTETLEASRRLTAERQKRREVLTDMLRSLAHYVEDNCKGDLATLLSSGFNAASTTRTASQPLPLPSIVRIDHGNITGQMLVMIKPLKRARHYEVRYAPVGDGQTPGGWTQVLVPAAKAPVPVNGLTPGTNYVFQVRAYNRFGYSDWSDSINRMCV